MSTEAKPKFSIEEYEEKKDELSKVLFDLELLAEVYEGKCMGLNIGKFDVAYSKEVRVQIANVVNALKLLRLKFLAMRNSFTEEEWAEGETFFINSQLVLKRLKPLRKHIN